MAVTEKQVAQIHDALTTELTDARAHRESPRIIRILECLLSLTGEETDGPISMPMPKCLHEHIDPKTGKCKDCDAQVFQFRNPGV